MTAEHMNPSIARRVAFFPTAAALAGNPYWSILHDGLEAAGVTFVEPPDGRLLRWLRETRRDPVVLHLHYVQQFYAYEGEQARLRWVLRLARNLVLARLWGHRVVFTLHNLTPTYPLRPEWVDRLGHRVAATLSDSVIVHCRRAAELLAETYGRRRNVRIVPHPHYIGIYPDTVSRETARASFGYGPNEVVLAFIGGVRPNKGIDRLLRAFAQVANPRLRLLIAGKPGPPPAHIDALHAAAAGDPRIRLCLEFIPDDELQLYYRAADAVVLPFARILTSGSAMLAMSFGRAVIVPRMGCLAELPGDAAIHYEPGDDEALARVLDGLNDQDLNGKGLRALVVAQSKTPEEFIAGTLAAYQNRHDGSEGS